MTARSALGLRLILSVAALMAFIAGTVGFAIWANASGVHDSPSPTVLVVLAVVCGTLAAVAVLDLVVILRRRRRGNPTA